MNSTQTKRATARFCRAVGCVRVRQLHHMTTAQNGSNPIHQKHNTYTVQVAIHSTNAIIIIVRALDVHANGKWYSCPTCNIRYEAQVATSPSGQQVAQYCRKARHWLPSWSHHHLQCLPSQRPLHHCLGKVTGVTELGECHQSHMLRFGACASGVFVPGDGRKNTTSGSCTREGPCSISPSLSGLQQLHPLA